MRILPERTVPVQNYCHRCDDRHCRELTVEAYANVACGRNPQKVTRGCSDPTQEVAEHEQGTKTRRAGEMPPPPAQQGTTSLSWLPSLSHISRGRRVEVTGVEPGFRTRVTPARQPPTAAATVQVCSHGTGAVNRPREQEQMIPVRRLPAAVRMGMVRSLTVAAMMGPLRLGYPRHTGGILFGRFSYTFSVSVPHSAATKSCKQGTKNKRLEISVHWERVLLPSQPTAQERLFNGTGFCIRGPARERPLLRHLGCSAR